MQHEDDDMEQKIRQTLQKAGKVPFREQLQQRILEEAERQLVNVPGLGVKKRRWFRLLPNLTAAAAVFCVIAVGAWLYTQKKPQAGPIAPSGAFSSASQGSLASTSTSSLSLSKDAYLLYPAPITVQHIRFGQLPGWPAGSVVFTQLTNESNRIIKKSEIFGILSFSGKSVQSRDNFLSFVNGPKEIAPHATVTWSFHPVGAPVNAAGALSEQAQLAFYWSNASDIPSNLHDSPLVWRQSSILLSNISVLNGPTLARGQAITVDAQFTNPTKQTIVTHNLLAVVWFSNMPNQGFTEYGTARFLEHLPSSIPNKLAPGASFDVQFHVIGGEKTDYFSMTPHVQLVELPTQVPTPSP